MVGAQAIYLPCLVVVAVVGVALCVQIHSSSLVVRHFAFNFIFGVISIRKRTQLKNASESERNDKIQFEREIRTAKEHILKFVSLKLKRDHLHTGQ